MGRGIVGHPGCGGGLLGGHGGRLRAVALEGRRGGATGGRGVVPEGLGGDRGVVPEGLGGDGGVPVARGVLVPGHLAALEVVPARAGGSATGGGLEGGLEGEGGREGYERARG